MVKNPLLNEDYCYHSIGGDVFRIESILKHGILSQSELSKTGMPENSSNGFGYNGTNRVSVFVSPLFCESEVLGNGYADGIVFVCKADYSMHNVKSGIPSEAHVGCGIPRTDIKGIMLPDSFFHAPISKYYHFMCGLERLLDVCNSFAKWMKSECGYQASDYTELLKKLKKEKDVLKWDTIRDQIGKLVFGDLQKAVDKKLGKSGSTFADLVKYYIKDTKLVLYNREELEQDKTYKNRLKTRKIKTATQNVGRVYSNEFGIEMITPEEARIRSPIMKRLPNSRGLKR
ncbi:MAG: hypothetical protein J5613_00460 [Alphaproteobacteria bacterium]|nr:hypothetical protein [Alphaproteobacteria bacterium]